MAARALTFSAAEDEIIIKHYTECHGHPKLLVQYLPHRTASSIRQHIGKSKKFKKRLELAGVQLKKDRVQLDAMTKRVQSPYGTAHVKSDTNASSKHSSAPPAGELNVSVGEEDEDDEEEEETRDEESSYQSKTNTTVKTVSRSEFSPVWNLVFSKGYYPTVQLDEVGNAMIFVANPHATTTITADREQNAIHFEFCWSAPDGEKISKAHKDIEWVIKDKVKTELDAKPHPPQRMEFTMHLPSNYSAPHLKIIPDPQFAIVYLKKLADFSQFTTVFTIDTSNG